MSAMPVKGANENPLPPPNWKDVYYPSMTFGFALSAKYPAPANGADEIKKGVQANWYCYGVLSPFGFAACFARAIFGEDRFWRKSGRSPR